MNTKKVHSSHRAFTLIEILVVTTIITILISLMLPVLGRARETARRARCAGNQRQMIISYLSYGSDFNRYFPTATADNSAQAYTWRHNTPVFKHLSLYTASAYGSTLKCPGDPFYGTRTYDSDPTLPQSSWPSENNNWKLPGGTLNGFQFGYDYLGGSTPMGKSTSYFQGNTTYYIQNTGGLWTDGMSSVSQWPRLATTAIWRSPVDVLGMKYHGWIPAVAPTPATMQILADRQVSTRDLGSAFKHGSRGATDSLASKAYAPEYAEGSNVGYVDGHITWLTFNRMEEHRNTSKSALPMSGWW